MRPAGRIDFQRSATQIYNGQLAAGTELKEAVLAEEYGVSRGPVREARRRCRGFQLVTREPYQRARVVVYTGFRAPAVRSAHGARRHGLNLAAQRMTDEELRSIGAELEASRSRAITSSAAIRHAGEEKAFDFHERVVVRGCGNERIVEMLCGDLYHLLRIIAGAPVRSPSGRASPGRNTGQSARAPGA